MNIILFGPPGIGKSTLIGALKTEHFRAIDLEDVYPSGIRFQLPNMVNNVFLGGADLSPRRSYPNSVKVLLHMDQNAYEKRRAARDADIPTKANQTNQKVDDWLVGTKYNHVLSADRSIPSLVQELRKLAALYFKGKD